MWGKYRVKFCTFSRLFSIVTDRNALKSVFRQNKCFTFFVFSHFFLNTVSAVNGQSFVILLLSGLMNIHRVFVRIEEIYFVLHASVGLSSGLTRASPIPPCNSVLSILSSHTSHLQVLSSHPCALPRVSCLPVPSSASFYKCSCCSSLLLLWLPL